MTPNAEPDLEVHGEFWLPGTDDKKVPGILTFSTAEGGSLRLIGSFTEGFMRIKGSRTKDYSRILGQDDKTAYTLDGCQRTRERQTLGGGARQSFYVGQVIKDAWFGKDEAIEAEMVDVEITHLLPWTNISGLSEQGTFSEAAGGAMTEWRIIGVPQDPRVAELPFGRLELRHVVHPPSPDITGLRMGQDVYARFDFGSLRPLSAAIDYASDLQDLVSIATQRTAAFRGVPPAPGGVEPADLERSYRVAARSALQHVAREGRLQDGSRLGRPSVHLRGARRHRGRRTLDARCRDVPRAARSHDADPVRQRVHCAGRRREPHRHA